MNGLAVLVAIVVVGIATGAGLYRHKRHTMDARMALEVARAPRELGERLALWVRLVGPQIHHRLAVVGRFTPDLPWLVTHAVADEGGGPSELWGVECGELSMELARLEGERVVVELPPPRALGKATLDGERAKRVPLFARGAHLDAAQRLEELALYLLEDIPAALERDLPGATLVVSVVGRD